MPRITRNAIRCKKCGDVIESKTVHDFKFCSCGTCAVDGATITFAGVEILGIGKKCPKQKRLRATHIDLILIMGSW